MCAIIFGGTSALRHFGTSALWRFGALARSLARAIGGFLETFTR